jgi:hypothetical protein
MGLDRVLLLSRIENLITIRAYQVRIINLQDLILIIMN